MSEEIPLNLNQNEFVFLIAMWILSSGQISGDVPLTQTAMLLLSDLVDEKHNEFMTLRNKMEALSAKFAVGVTSLEITTQLKLALLIDLMETQQRTPKPAASVEKPLPENLTETFRDMFGKGRNLD